MLLRAPFDAEAVQAQLRPLYEAQRAAIVPLACDPAQRPRAELQPFFHPEEGRYRHAQLDAQPELQSFAETLSERRLQHVSTRLYCFRRGGYSLKKDDARTRVETGVEVLCDLSETSGAPFAHYGALAIPQLSGLVAVIERHPNLWRWDDYVPSSAGPVRIFRLRALYRFV